MAVKSLTYIPHKNTKSCLCFSSRTGCLIIGYSGLIAATLFWILMIYLSINNNYSSNKAFNIQIGSTKLWIILFYINCLLIIGIKEKKPKLILSWIHVNCFCYILAIIIIIIVIIIIIINSDDLHRVLTPYDSFFIIFWITLITAILKIWFHNFSVVVTYYKEIIDDQSYQTMNTA